MNPEQTYDEMISICRTLGRDVGLNADWSVSAFHVAGDFYILDDERADHNGYAEFSLVSRTHNDEDDEIVEHGVTTHTAGLRGLIQYAKGLTEENA